MWRRYWHQNGEILVFVKWSKGRKRDLTNKLRRSENVLKLVSCFNLMSNAKINQFDPGVRDVLIQQHDVLRLGGKEKEHKQAGQREPTVPFTDTENRKRTTLLATHD